MGVLGLRKFLDGASCSRYVRPPCNNVSDNTTTHANGEISHPLKSTSRAPQARAEHVLFDLNSLIHSCLNRLPSVEDSAAGAVCAAALQNNNAYRRKATITMVEDYLLSILTEVVMCTKTLTICIDGPAPIAKVRTQRLRRRRVSSISMGGSGQFSDLAITAGSPFLVQLENDLALFLQKTVKSELREYQSMSSGCSSGSSRGVVDHNDKKDQNFPNACDNIQVLINGSTCPGEGENKISQMLAYISSNHNIFGRYCPNDNVVIIGNDIDLVLTCFGATQYHNVYTFSPSSLQVLCVGEVIYRWLLKGTGFITDANILSSVRIDLIFIFSLNGGDHFPGIGDAGSDIWRRYKMIRASSPERSLVSPDLCSLDTHLLYDVLQCDEYKGNANTKPGFQVLVCALWATYTTVTGICPDYRFSVPDDLNPTISHLKAATSTRKTVSLHYKDKSAPLTPLANFAALMPTIETLPRGLQDCLCSPSTVTAIGIVNKKAPVGSLMSKKDITDALRGNDTSRVVKAAEDLLQLALAEGTLSHSEQYRAQFSTSVLLCNSVRNAPESAEIANISKSLTRRMPDHIREKKKAMLAILRDQASKEAPSVHNKVCPTEVIQITNLPKDYIYNAPYMCKELLFSRLFGNSLSSGEQKEERIVRIVQEVSRAEGYDGGEHNVYKVEKQKREDRRERNRTMKQRKKLLLLKKGKEGQLAAKTVVTNKVKK